MMRKIISCILCLAICITLLAVPVHAESNIYSAYLGVLNDAVEKYGEYTAGEYQKSTGVGYVNLVDFDGDGVNELIYCVGETHDYTYHIYGYKDGSAVLLDEGSMEAHGGDSNWEISILYNSAKSRLITYRHDGPYMNSTYISVGEYSDGEWNTLKDIFVEDYCEVEPGGAYYMVYYINNEQVDESEFNNRFNSLSRHGGRIDIRWTDFSGEYLEEVRQSLSDMNYWLGSNTEEVAHESQEYYKENYKEYVDAMYEAYDCGYIDPYTGETYPSGNKAFNNLFATEAIQRLWQDFALNTNSDEYEYWKNKLGFCTVFRKNSLDEALQLKFGISIDDLLKNDIQSMLYKDNDYIVIGAFGRGERSPGAVVVVDALNELDDGRISCSWHMENEWYTEQPSNEMYTVLKKEQIEGKEIIAYNYLSVMPYDNYLTQDAITVKINGNKIVFDKQPIIIDGSTMVPMRKIFEELGAQVEWNGQTQTITAVNNRTRIVLSIGDNTIIKDENAEVLNTAPLLIDGVTYVPVRAIAEAFDADVSWNGNTRTVNIKYSKPKATATPKPSATFKPGRIITGNNEYDSYIYSQNTNIPLKTILHDFDGDGTDEVVAIYGTVKDKNTNMVYGDAILYHFGGESSNKTILSGRNFYLNDVYLASDRDNDGEETDLINFRIGYESLKLDYLYEYVNDEFIVKEMLGGTAIPYNKSVWEESWGAVKNNAFFAQYGLLFGVFENKNIWHAVEMDNQDFDLYTDMNGKDVFSLNSKPYYFTVYYTDPYQYEAIEVTPDYLKTFKNGKFVYDFCQKEKAKGHKVQVLYRANGYIHVNIRQYNENLGYVMNSNVTYRTNKGYVSNYQNAYGIYRKNNGDEWIPKILPDPTCEAWQYQTDTSKDFNDVSSLFEGHTLTNELSATVDDENISERIAIARANLLLKNSNYEYLKKLDGVDKAFAGNLNAALPAAYHSLNNYRSQLLKSAGLPTNYKTFYELVLIDLLSYKTDSDNTTSKLGNTLSAVGNYIDAGYKDTKNRRKAVNSILKLIGVEKGASYKLFDDTVGDIFKLIDSGKASIEEGTKVIGAMTEFNKYTDEKIAVLDSIYEKTDDNELKKACVSVKQYVNAAKNKNMNNFKSKLDIHTEVTLNEIVDWEINSFTDIIVDEMIKGVEGVSSAAGSVLIGAKAGKDIGLLIGNQLFDADNMTTAMLTLDTLCKIDDTLKSVLNDTEAKYKSDMTYENAIKLTTAADLSKTLQMYSCDVTKDLVNSVKKNEQNMYKYAPILPYNSILTITKRAMGKMPDYDYLEQTLDKLKGQFEAMDLYMGGIDIAEYIYSDKSTESSDWSKPYIERALRYGILPDYLRLGYKRGLTRAEFCTYIVNLLEAKSGKNIYDLITEEGQLITSPFDDCTYYYVDCVYKLGIISGMSANEFKPLGNLTREQAAKILYETAKILGIDTSASASNLTGVSEWAKDGVNFVVDRNIMTGTDNGFEPQSGYSKEQALTSLVRFYENLK